MNRTSGCLLRIGRRWKVGWRTATRHRNGFGVLMRAGGDGVTAIVRTIGKTKRTAYRWRDRYVACGIEGLKRDATRPSRKPPLSAEVIKRVVEITLHQMPPAGTHWSVHKLAKVVGLSPSSVQRIWAAHRLKPHLIKKFKLSNDKGFVEKVQDVAGVYLNPPNRPWCFASMRRAKSRRSTARSRGCPSRRGGPAR
ncbi:MAG: helix-turn-helix domain-containing protein [Mesorhizobium sp.]|nr:MAG: helix-turn-helix domain-containing protein [Mesorhizobium sp.]